MFYPSTFTLSDGFVLTQSGDFYKDGKTTLTVSGSGKREIALRQPGWANASSIVIKLNGEGLNTEVTDGYYVIEREWKSGDKIEYEVPFTFHLDSLKGTEDTYALMYGPLVLVADLGNENIKDIQDNQLSFGTAYVGSITNKLVLAGDVGEIATVNIVDGRLVIMLKTENLGELTFRPFNDLFHSRYIMYFELYDSKEYEIIEGKEIVYEKESGDLILTSTADFDKFVSVLVDGNEIDSSCYTITEGSTIIALKAQYLETLSEGEHIVTVVSNDGKASAMVTISAKKTPAQTGDNKVIASASLAVVSALFGLVVLGRKKRIGCR
jgi:hypothetical protein